MKLTRLAPSCWPIAAKLSTTLLAVALIPMGLTTYFNLRESFADVEVAAYQNLELLAISHSAQLDQLILDNQRIVKYFAQHPLIVEYLSVATTDRPALQADVQAALLQLQGADPGYEFTYLIDQTGTCIASPALPELVGSDLQFREYFQVPQQQRKSFVSSILQGIKTGRPGLFFSAPVVAPGGQFLGVAVIKLRADVIWMLVDNLRFQVDKGAFLIDKSGVIIAHPDRDRLYHSLTDLSPETMAEVMRDRRYAVDKIPSLSLPTLAKAMIGAQKPGYVRHYFPDLGYAQVVGFAPLKNQDWVMGVFQPESSLAASLQRLQFRSYFALGISAVGASILAVILIQTIVRPIRDLTTAVAEVEQGKFTLVLEDRGDELGTLARAFNAMEQRLQTSFTQLAEAKANLERRVEERTMELTKALQDLRQAQSHLVQTEKMSSLGQMVAGVAHEINNPVNFIHGNIQHMEDYTQDLQRLIAAYQQHYPHPPTEIQTLLDEIDLGFLTEDLIKLMQSMKLGTNRIRQIVSSLRNFSRVDEADLKAVNVHEGIDNTLMILQHRLGSTSGKPRIEIMKHYGSLPLVECFPGQLNQVFMNLLANAIDALDGVGLDGMGLDVRLGDRPPTITITTLGYSDQIQIAIADNGLGMDESVRSRIFDPFFTTKAVGKGTGLGLFISYQVITEKHNGLIRCESIPGNGTTFFINIPVRHEHPSDAKATKQSATTPQES